MGFFNRFKVALSKSVGLNNEQVRNKEYIGFDSDNKSLFEDNLAINNPVRFISKYVNNAVINKAIELNPNIKRILEEYNLPLKFEIQNVTSIMMSHLIPTAKVTQKIYSKMGHKKEQSDYLRLTQAALLHDIGKVFIPAEILNKRGKLTPKERKIVELHNKLSYEILKTTNLHFNVAKFALEHHNYEKNVKKSHENQALTIADVYCALREKRPYKKSFSDITAKTILYDMGAKGELDSGYISCLF